MTPIQQWDAILELMQQWSRIDSVAEPQAVVEFEDLDEDPFIVPDHQESEEEEVHDEQGEEEDNDVSGSGWTAAELIQASR